ncbi:hypothetical protein B0H13DRAFT_1887684 [Mycena leptocephala]|nr:hypothetical protein B0H13DRAFT_1887684 [Mycena leptocephala]
MTDPQTIELFGWNHANLCWQIFDHRQPRRKTELTLNLVAQFTYVANPEDDNSRVYTPMDVDGPAVYSTMDVDDSKLYTPMDVDDSDGFHPGGTAWNTFDHNTTSAQHDEELQASSKHVHSKNTPPGGSTNFHGVQGLNKSKMENRLSTSCPNNLRLSSSLPNPVQQQWETWDLAPLQTQKSIYKEKWAVLKQNRQPMFLLEFRHIPWPIFRSAESNLDVSTPTAELSLTRGTPPTNDSRKLAKHNLRLFHSDKFASTLERVVPRDRERARESAETGTPASDLVRLLKIYIRKDIVSFPFMPLPSNFKTGWNTLKPFNAKSSKVPEDQQLVIFYARPTFFFNSSFNFSHRTCQEDLCHHLKLKELIKNEFVEYCEEEMRLEIEEQLKQESTLMFHW